ncbi:MAG TPA: WD40 repeat domain-containing protein, partial [Gemmataceae bacterium]|nr:WD40 repeat domain-containing protein [Gemmataceae bacterium]
MRRLIVLAGLAAVLFVAFPAQAQEKRKDAFGDPLPPGAVARIGTLRYRLPHPQGDRSTMLSPDGKLLAVVGIDSVIEWIELPAWKHVRRMRNAGIERAPQLYGEVFSADGKKLAACDAAGLRVFLFDVATGKLSRQVRLPAEPDGANLLMALSCNDKALVCTYVFNQGKGSAKKLVVWDLVKDKVRHSFTIAHDPFSAPAANVAVSADGAWLAQTVNNRPVGPGRGAVSRLEVWNLNTGKRAAGIDTDMRVVLPALSSDGKWLAVIGESSLLRIYETAALKERHNIRGRASITHLVFGPNNDLYQGDADGKISRWNPATGERTANWPAPARAAVTQLVFTPEAKMLAFGFAEDAVHFWDVEKGTRFSPVRLPEGIVENVAFSPRGELFTASLDGLLAWWNSQSGARLRDLKLESNGFRRDRSLWDDEGFLRPAEFPDRPLGATYTMSSNGEFLHRASELFKTIYDARTGKILYDHDQNPRQDFDGLASDACFLDGGNKCIALRGSSVRIWNTRSGRDIASITLSFTDKERVNRFSASGGNFCATEVIERNATQGSKVILWDMGQRKRLREWTAPVGTDAMCFSPDEQWFALSRVQEPLSLCRAGAPRAEFELIRSKNVGHGVAQLAFSPDSRQLACSFDKLSESGHESSRIVIYEVASKKIRLTLVGHATGRILRFAFAHDSGLLASGSSDTTALVWKAGLRANLDPPLPAEAAPADLDAWYGTMAGSDAPKAFQAMIQLARSRGQAVKLLENKIAPAAKPDIGGKAIKQWIRELGSSNFAVRTRASQTLQKIGAASEAELRQALQGMI